MKLNKIPFTESELIVLNSLHEKDAKDLFWQIKSNQYSFDVSSVTKSEELMNTWFADFFEEGYIRPNQDFSLSQFHNEIRKIAQSQKTPTDYSFVECNTDHNGNLNFVAYISDIGYIRSHSPRSCILAVIDKLNGEIKDIKLT